MQSQNRSNSKNENRIMNYSNYYSDIIKYVSTQNKKEIENKKAQFKLKFMFHSMYLILIIGLFLSPINL